MSLPEKPAIPGQASDTAKGRAKSWWKVYTAGCFLYPLGMTLLAGAPGTIFFVPLVFFMVPIGLSYTFGSLIVACRDGTWHPILHDVEAFAFLTLPFSYGIFWLHFHLTAKAKTRRAFYLLMLSLVLLICGSIPSCMRESSRPIGMQN